MSLIPQEELTTLKAASAVKTISENAEADQQIMTIAYQINTAANTGATSILFMNALLPATKAALTSKKYTIKPIGSNVPCDHFEISWR